MAPAASRIEINGAVERARCRRRSLGPYNDGNGLPGPVGAERCHIIPIYLERLWTRNCVGQTAKDNYAQFLRNAHGGNVNRKVSRSIIIKRYGFKIGDKWNNGGGG